MNFNSKKKKTALLTVSILLSLSVPVYAAQNEDSMTEKENTVKTPDVIVTATRTEMELQAVPNTVEVITAEDIERLGATDVASALRLADNINIMTNGSTGFGKRISIRGMDTNDLLVLVDGRRTSNEDTSTSANMFALDRINISNVERIEIVRGAASAQYGSDALAGVINIITKKSSGNPSATVGVSTGTNDMHNYYHIDLGKQGNFSSVLDIDFGKLRKRMIGAGDYSSLNGPTQNYNFKGTWDLSDDDSITFGASYYKADLTADWSKAFGSIPSFVMPSKEAILNTQRYDYNIGYNGKSDSSNYSLDLYYSKLDKERFLPYQAFMREGKEKNKYSIWGIEAKNTVQADENNILTYGLSFEENKVEGANFGNDGSDDKNTKTYAGYLQDEWMVNDKLLLIPAIRYDHHSDFGSEATPKIGATYFLNDNSRFKINWGKGFKAPTVSELYMDYTHMGAITLGNPDLKPEKSTNYDISFEAEADGNFGKLTYFNNKIDNRIATRSVSGLGSSFSEYYNIDGTTKTHGIELTLGRQFNDKWKIKATSNWTSGTDDTGTDASAGAHGADGIADNVSTLQLIYDDSKNGFSATLWNEWVKGYYYASTAKDYTYNTTNIVFNKKIGDNSRVYAGLDNIFNNKEEDINLNGRIWRLGAEFTF